MLDLGANPDCNDDHLVQFAVMGSVIASDLHGIKNPRVGLLNVGEEDIKGTEEIKAAHKRLLGSAINYCGFVEGDKIFSGDVDVVVTDGFTGNVSLKTMEGLARFITGAMKEEFTRSPLRKASALAAMPALNALKVRLDPRRYNGASMVGLNGVVIKSHGGADRVSFANAVHVAVTEARNGVPAQIGALLARVNGKAQRSAARSRRSLFSYFSFCRRRRMRASNWLRRRTIFRATSSDALRSTDFFVSDSRYARKSS